jgi:hypothetical protein
MNNNITLPNADPDKCYSLVDAMAKTHDWEYEVAEHSGANEASLKMAAGGN